MITAREIAVWRTVAPWATDMMVEQDYLHGLWTPHGISPLGATICGPPRIAATGRRSSHRRSKT